MSYYLRWGLRGYNVRQDRQVLLRLTALGWRERSIWQLSEDYIRFLALLLVIRKQKKSKKQTFEQVRALLSDYLQKQDFSLLIDGKTDFGLMRDLQIPIETLIKGDAKIRGIAMASILAKVERDQFMISLAKKYPERDFDQHKGYGTKNHYLKIAYFWTCSQHRKLFLKQIFPSLTFEKFDWKILFTEKPLE